MLNINKEKIFYDLYHKKYTNICYFAGNCSTCEYSPDNEKNLKCSRADFKDINILFSKSFKIIFKRNICLNWELNSKIIDYFKKNNLFNLKFSNENLNTNNKRKTIPVFCEKFFEE